MSNKTVTFYSKHRSIPRVPLIQRTLRRKSCTSSGTVVCPPFGLVPSCLGVSLSKLSTTLSSIDSLVSGCTTLFLQSCSFKDWEAHMSVNFKQVLPILTDANYHSYSSHLTHITLCIQHLEKSLLLRRQISSHVATHQPTSTTEIRKVLHNLKLLFDVLQSLRSGMQQQFWNMLDSDVQASTGKLGRVIASVSLFFSSTNVLSLKPQQIPSTMRNKPLVNHITWRHISNLGVARWLDDELINHFC